MCTRVDYIYLCVLTGSVSLPEQPNVGMDTREKQRTLYSKVYLFKFHDRYCSPGCIGEGVWLAFACFERLDVCLMVLTVLWV